MIAQQLQIVCRSGLLLALAILMAACSSTVEKPDYPSSHSNSGSRIGETAAQIALQQVGVPYRYGGQSPSGFDCSGLVHYAYARAGLSIPRTTAQLWSGTHAIERGGLQPGDLLFFSISGKMSHVGLYLGDGRFVHAPSTGKTVRVESLSSTFYRQAFLRAGRPK
jgi:cell wall-associated NlpC family hydrolase